MSLIKEPGVLDIVMNKISNKLRARVLTHDLSKFMGKQFDIYRKKFFPVKEGECKGDLFKSAWKHHYTYEEHHPEGFDQDNIMEPLDVIEMCLDWCAMSMKFGDDPLKYYNDKKPELKEDFPWLIDNYNTLIIYILDIVKDEI